MTEEQIKEALNTLKALVEANSETNDIAKLGSAAGLLLLESFLINQSKQTAALEAIAISMDSIMHIYHNRG